MAESSSRAFMTEAKELADAGQFGKAIEILQQGLKSFPKMVSARVLLGEVYWLSGDAKLARVELEQVLQTTPDNFAAHRKLASVYRDLGDRHAAAKACEAVLQANPKDREMSEMLEELLGAAPEVKAEEGAMNAPAHEGSKAEPTTTLRLAKSPVVAPPVEEEPTLSLEMETEETDSETLAELYVTQGHRDKALQVYRRLVTKDPDNMKLHERIMALEEEEGGSIPTLPRGDTPAQATRKARIRRLEGWLAVIRERRRT